MNERGYKYRYMDHLTPGLLINRLDCDTSSFVVLAAAYEFHWPVYGVSVPGHFFVRWNDGQGTRFNMDFGEETDDEFYRTGKYLEMYPGQEVVPISDDAIANGVYLRDIPFAQLESISFEYLCFALGKQDRSVEALAACNRALEIDPKNLGALVTRGNAQRSLSSWKSASDYLEAYWKDPKDSYSRMGLAQWYQDMGKHQEALDLYQAAASVDPRSPQPWLGAGLVYLDQGQYESAVLAYDKAIYRASVQYAVEIYLAKNAVSYAQQGALLPPDGTVDQAPLKMGAEAYYGNGSAKMRITGRFLEGIHDLEMATQLDPENVDYRRALGEAYLAMASAFENSGDWVQARDYREKARRCALETS